MRRALIPLLQGRFLFEEALENIWPGRDEGIYIATLTVTPTHKAVIADEWEYEDGDEGREYRIEKIQL